MKSVYFTFTKNSEKVQHVEIVCCLLWRVDVNEAHVSALKKQLSDVRYFDSPKCFEKRLDKATVDLELI